MNSGIGAAMQGGRRGNGVERPRQHLDWYPTPPDCTEALLDRIHLKGPVWEPCCGDGSLARVMEARGLKVIGTDLFDRGYGEGHGDAYDILKVTELLADEVVTNPPFNIAAPIIRHLLSLRPRTLALLLKSSFWHASSRAALFHEHPPSRIIALTWRPDFLGLKRPAMEVIWTVWERDHEGPTAYELAARPRGGRIRLRDSHPGVIDSPGGSIDHSGTID
jgi:Dimethyladenosine transferase (rRNA methylation)